MKRILLGIDIGTSACKVAAFNFDGKALAQSSKNITATTQLLAW